MVQIFLIIIGCYVAYYVVNILYDLFFKKSPVIKTDNDGEVVNLGAIIGDDKSPIKSVQIEDVENVSMPASYEADETDLFNTGGGEVDSEALETSFEEEKYIEDYYSEQKQEDRETEELKVQEKDFSETQSKLKQLFNLKADNIISQTKEFVSNKSAELDNQFDNFLEKAQASVVLTDNIDGHKVYKSTL